MKLVWLSCGSATGKSTVTSLLRRLGARIVDADEIARQVVEPGQEAWREIVGSFGREFLRADQTVDREKLRKKVFADLQARKRLESITHPRIRALAQQRIQQLAGEGAEPVVYVAPLLFENQAHLWIRPIILVACDANTQIARLRKRDGLSEEEARLHLQAQMSLEEKRKLADFVIENSGSLEELERQVEKVWEKIR